MGVALAGVAQDAVMTEEATHWTCLRHRGEEGIWGSERVPALPGLGPKAPGPLLEDGAGVGVSESLLT